MKIKEYKEISIHAFGMEMNGRKWQGTANNFRYSHNGHEKQEEVFVGAQSAEFWMYDSRIGRRWERDPVVKPWESPYTAFSNNSILKIDPIGLDVINAHKASREKALTKLNECKDKLTSMKKGDEGYKQAKHEFKKARSEFREVNSKYLRVEAKIDEIKLRDPELYKSADKLTDPGGTKIDIYIYDTPHDVLQGNVKEGMVKYGDTDAKPGTFVTSNSGSTSDYFMIESKKHGENTITIRISDASQAIDLAHEFGHGIYQAKNMIQYVQWLTSNPKEQGKGGHGKGDPSGKAARDAEKNFYRK